jgi:hypothetical protein
VGVGDGCEGRAARVRVPRPHRRPTRRPRLLTRPGDRRKLCVPAAQAQDRGSAPACSAAQARRSAGVSAQALPKRAALAWLGASGRLTLGQPARWSTRRPAEGRTYLSRTKPSGWSASQSR